MSFQRRQTGNTPPASSLRPVHLVLIVSLGANAWFLGTWAPEDSSPEPPAEEPSSEAAGVAEESGAGDVPAEGETPAGVEAPGSPETEPTPAPLDIPARFVRVVIDGPISRGFVKALGSPEGDRLALTMSRLIVWNMDLFKDPRPGDIADVLYEVDSSGQMRVLGLRYHSKKFNRDFTAWSHKPKGWKYASWFDSTGREVPGRLEGGPIEKYEEITALLGDGRRHEGMDFKTPVGTKVSAPFDGVVTRTTWSFKYNGNCVELRSAKGTKARFLHLSELSPGLKSGDRVSRGQAIAKSGNTGRSSAPHLHYELSRGGKTIDPLSFHKVTHTQLLAEEEKRAFEQRKGELVDWMERAVADHEG